MRKQIAFAVGGVSVFIATLSFGMWLSDPNRGKPDEGEIMQKRQQEMTRDYKINSQSVVTPEENWIALSEREMSSIKVENGELKKKLEQISSQLDEMQKKKESQVVEDVDFKMSAPLPVPDPAMKLPPIPLPGMAGISSGNDSGINPPMVGEGKLGIDIVDLNEGETVDKVGQKKVKNISHFLPSGSFAKVVLLSGVDAPTGGMAQQNPMPVLMKLLDHGQLPNFFKSKIKDCHVTGAAAGEISSERANIRIEKLSCVLEQGDVVEVALQGFVTGEDGKNGLRGTLVSKQGSLIARAALAGVVSGMGTAVTQQYQQVQTTALGTMQRMNPAKVAQAGLAQGASNALEKVAQFYIDRANETYPIIEIEANRRGEVILTNGVDLESNILAEEVVE